MSAPASVSDPVCAAAQAPRPWTCPFCPLLCDDFSVRNEGPGLELVGSDCPRARTALARFEPGPSTAACQIDGVDCDAEAAIQEAALRLGASRQPLFGGLGTDVAGARALYTLACRTGAICDPAGGAALFHGLLALQDRGAFTTTLAEVHTRADLIVCVGSMPSQRYPEFLRRCGVTAPPDAGQAARVVWLQPTSADASETPPDGVERIRCEGDLFDVAALLAACVAGRPVIAPPNPLAALAARLHAARYAVLAYEPGRLPAHGGLVIEAIGRVVATLNRRNRAAALALGGDDGASTVNAVFTWLSGLPLRSRAAPVGLEHEPLRFDAGRLLLDGGVDALLWIASFGTEPPPPPPHPPQLPRVVLGHPALAASARGPATVFIPVATPGIGAAGHLFRTDGSVLMPLRPVRHERLPTVADVLMRLTLALPGAVA